MYGTKLESNSDMWPSFFQKSMTSKKRSSQVMGSAFGGTLLGMDSKNCMRKSMWTKIRARFRNLVLCSVVLEKGAGDIHKILLYDNIYGRYCFLG